MTFRVALIILTLGCSLQILAQDLVVEEVCPEASVILLDENDSLVIYPGDTIRSENYKQLSVPENSYTKLTAKNIGSFYLFEGTHKLSDFSDHINDQKEETIFEKFGRYLLKKSTSIASELNEALIDAVVWRNDLEKVYTIKDSLFFKNMEEIKLYDFESGHLISKWSKMGNQIQLVLPSAQKDDSYILEIEFPNNIISSYVLVVHPQKDQIIDSINILLDNTAPSESLLREIENFISLEYNVVGLHLK